MLRRIVMSSDRPEDTDTFASLFERTGKAVPSRKGPRIGDRRDVLVVQVGRDSVFVEFEGRRQGYIDAADLRGPDGTIRAAAGSRLGARVVQVDAEQGVRFAPTVEAAVEVGAAVALGDAAEASAVRVAVGETVACVVDRIESYGLFVQIEGTRGRAGRGLVPAAELGLPRGTDLRKTFAVGAKLKAKIVAIGEGKLRLSTRALKDDEERSQFDAFREKEREKERERGRTGASSGLGTLGDLLKKRR
jgi:small subunit ribosomal protein S1